MYTCRKGGRGAREGEGGREGGKREREREGGMEGWREGGKEGGKERREEPLPPGSQSPERDAGGSETMRGKQMTSILCVREGGREGGFETMRGEQRLQFCRE